MTRILSVPAAAVLIVLCSGCLQKETTHTLYLAPDGAVTWTVHEQGVRSDESTPSTRWSEERDFLDAVNAGRHPVALALRHIGGSVPGTRLLRADRPYEVQTSATFASVDHVAAAILADLRLPGRAALQRTGRQITLRVEFTAPAEEDEGTHEGPLAALAEEWSRYRIVLTDGRFVAAEGFAISASGTLAKPVEQELAPEDPIRLALTWEQ